MNIRLIPTTDIICEDRQRSELVGIEELADSIRNYDLIEPLVVSIADDAKYHLVAGGRRLAALKYMNVGVAPCIIREDLTPAEAAELELEENVRRNDLPWQDRCKAIARIHRLRDRDAALSGKSWGTAQTGALLGMSNTPVWYALKVAEALDNKDDVLMRACDNMQDAIQLLVARRAEQAEGLIRQKMTQLAGTTPANTTIVNSDPFPNLPGVAAPAVTVSLLNEDCIDWLRKQPDASVDHIYTDPPYAIDMDNLDQDGSGIADVGLVRGTHEVDENEGLLRQLFGEVPRVLKPTGFFVLWCDQDVWPLLVALATQARLRYQRWPVTWVKTSACKNGQAYKNFTKTTEIAMVCAMPKATLAKPRSSCHWVGPSDKANYPTTNPFWKPIDLHKWILEGIAVPGSTIVDLFAGSGSIPLACVRAGYNVVGVELDITHFVSMQQIVK